MADAFKVAEDGNAGFLLNARYQTFATPGYDEINGTTEACKHFTHAGTICCGGHLNCSGRQSSGFKALLQGFGNDHGRLKAIGTAAQDGGIAGLHAEGAGVGCNIWAAFKNNSDDADGHAHARNFHAIGSRPFAQGRANGIGQPRNVLKALGHGFNAIPVESQAVNERFFKVLGLCRCYFGGIYGQEFIGRGADGHCHG
jgi:hypothetical protein